MIAKLAGFALLALSAGAACAQARDGFYAAPVAEYVNYGERRSALGLGFALSGGDGICIGARFLYLLPINEKDFSAFEIAVFLRAYPAGVSAYSGLFFQLDTGASVFSTEKGISFPEEGGSLSIGLSAGWRFMLKERFYIEPYLRGGYPYRYGFGLSAGIRF